MTTHKSFKRLVRARMEKTGESYTSARAAMLSAAGGPAKAADGPVLPMSDATIRARTGRGWEEWFDLLDEWGAAERPRADALAWVMAEHGLDDWGAQSVTITYERARGLRAVGEHADGFTITASKTIAVPVEQLYDAVVDPVLRALWLPESALLERTATRPQRARFDWADGATRVNVFFEAKGEAKSTVTVQHERLDDAAEADRTKAFWRERVSTLKRVLEA